MQIAQSILSYGIRDLINSHYLVTYNEGLSRDNKDFIEALATTHLNRVLITSNADYNISFEIKSNLQSLGLTSAVISNQ